MAHSPLPWTLPVECAAAAAQDIHPKMLGELFREKTRWETANVMDRFPLLYYTLRGGGKTRNRASLRGCPGGARRVRRTKQCVILAPTSGPSPEARHFADTGGLTIAAK